MAVARPREAPSGERIVRVGLGVAAAVVAAQITAHLVDYWALGLRFPSLDSASEDSVFARLGTFAILACALATFALARRMRSRLALVLGVACAWLFVDAFFEVRDHVPHRTLVYIPLLAAVLVGYWLLASSFAAPARRLVHAALALLVLSAAIHLLGPSLLDVFGWGPSDWPYQVKIALKEATEIAGWSLLATGVASRYAAYR
jgi:hypothetical protein